MPSAAVFAVSVAPLLMVVMPAYELRAERTFVPPPDKVKLVVAAPLITPETVKVLPEVTFQVWLAPKATGVATAILTVEADRSTLLAPSVSVPAPVMAMSVKALATLMPPHELEVPSVKPAPRELPFQVATSVAAGELLAPAPPVQAPTVAPVRSVTEPVFVATCACMAVADIKNKVVKKFSQRNPVLNNAGRVFPNWKLCLVFIKSLGFRFEGTMRWLVGFHES